MDDTQSEGMYDHFPFFVAPRPPTAEEVAVNTTANFVWPGLEFDILKSGEAVYGKGLLLPLVASSPRTGSI